jgi:hypothetical protein
MSRWGHGCRAESRRRLVYAPFSVLGHPGQGMRPFFSLYYDPMKIFGLSLVIFAKIILSRCMESCVSQWGHD